MGQDAFMKPEIPEPMRDLMKMSIEQTKRAFETFASASEKTWKSLESSSQSARTTLYSLNAKFAEITRRNAEANFILAMRLAETKDFNQAIDLQSEHVRKQMETFMQQLEEVRDLTAQIVQDAAPAPAPRVDGGSGKSAPSNLSGPRGSTPGASAGPPHAPSSTGARSEAGRAN
jgi:phasin